MIERADSMALETKSGQNLGDVLIVEAVVGDVDVVRWTCCWIPISAVCFGYN